jgi:hypothetical protein
VQFIETEVRSATGRVDAVVKTKDTIYVFEFKLDSNRTVEEALKQTDGSGYFILYGGDSRQLVKVGVVFDTAKRSIGEWRIADAVNS